MSLMTPILSQFPLTRWPLIMAGFSLAMLLGAWGFEYIGKYLPCALCYDQRYIHMAVIGLGLASGIGLILRPGLARFAPYMIFAVALVLLYSAGFAGWHAGIEYDWWAGPASCTAGGTGNISAGSILDALESRVIVPMCDEASWTLFGISMAGYNALISLVMAGVSIFVGYRGLEGEAA